MICIGFNCRALQNDSVLVNLLCICFRSVVWQSTEEQQYFFCVTKHYHIGESMSHYIILLQGLVVAHANGLSVHHLTITYYTSRTSEGLCGRLLNIENV
jgi:hypothetical protein